MPKIQQKLYRKVRKGVKSFINEIEEIMTQPSNTIVIEAVENNVTNSPCSTNNSYSSSNLSSQESDVTNIGNNDIWKHDYLLENETLNVQEHSDDILPSCQFDKSISDH